MSCAHYDDYQNSEHVGKETPKPNADTFNGLI